MYFTDYTQKSWAVAVVAEYILHVEDMYIEKVDCDKIIK